MYGFVFADDGVVSSVSFFSGFAAEGFSASVDLFDFEPMLFCQRPDA
jgi:hypothetical protein